MIANTVMGYIQDVYGHKLSQWNHDLLRPNCLNTYTDAISNIGVALDNCFGFIDGTVCPNADPLRTKEQSLMVKRVYTH